MINNGWVKLHRSLLEWEWWDDKNTTRVFLTLLLLANHKTTSWKKTVIQAGQVVTGRFQLAIKTGLSERMVRTALARLQTTSELTIRTTNKYSIITFNKWEDYQMERPSERPTTGMENDQRPTTNKKDKNIRSKERDISPLGDPPKEKKEPRSEVQRVVLHLEATLNTKIVSFPKQAKAWKMMHDAGYTEPQICGVITLMWDDAYWKERGFDLMTVCNQIPKIAARLKDLAQKERAHTYTKTKEAHGRLDA